MKIYTKTGDNGTTGLFDGTRVSKSNEIFDVLGTLDELSAHIGMLCALEEKNDTLKIFLRTIQRHLLDIGSVIATPTKKDMSKYNITEEDIKNIEIDIDRMEADNAPLTKFILAGVNKSDSQSHICRAVCRRLEREMIRYSIDSERDFPLLIKYINRLSDYFFVLSRNLSGCEEEER